MNNKVLLITGSPFKVGVAWIKIHLNFNYLIAHLPTDKYENIKFSNTNWDKFNEK